MAGRSYSSAAAREQAADEANPLEGVYFELDGQRFECQGKVNILDTSEMAAAADAALDTRDPEGMAIISRFLKAAFGPQEYRRIRAHFHAHDTPDELMLDIIGGIVEDVEGNVAALTARPTRSLSGSARGRQARGGRTSRISALQQGDVHLISSDGETMSPDLAAERAAQEEAKAAAKATRRQPARTSRAKRPAASRVVKLG